MSSGNDRVASQISLDEIVRTAVRIGNESPVDLAIRAWARLRRSIGRSAERDSRITGAELMNVLHSVAATSASGSDVEETLDTIVTQAKRVTDTEKALLVLVDLDLGANELDFESVVVRGARDQHPESWWVQHVHDLAAEVLESNNVVVKRDRERGAWMLCAPAPTPEGPIGLLCAINSRERPFSPDEVSFLGILGAFAASAIVNARLVQQARLSLLASERDRIAREMHDGLAQSLFSASLGLEVCRKALGRDPEDADRRLVETQRLLSDSMGELRHYIYDLRSPRLAKMGLSEAVRSYLEDVTQGRERKATFTVEGKPARPLDEPLEACLYRVAREAITNAVRHSKCRNMNVEIVYDQDTVSLAILDDGMGFNVQSAFSDATQRGSLGLRNIRDRVRAAGGVAEIASSEDGGTHVRVRVPY